MDMDYGWRIACDVQRPVALDGDPASGKRIGEQSDIGLDFATQGQRVHRDSQSARFVHSVVTQPVECWSTFILDDCHVLARQV
jgi:hypothetical protein